MTGLHDSGLRMALDYAGVAVFAATGALAAARRGYDITTFAFFAAITGIGGGTLRDLLIGAPVFWVSGPGYVSVCILMAGLVWALGDRLARFRTLLWLDAAGLAAYCVVGASKAADWGAPPVVAVVMGVLTASFGGVVRDVLAGEPSVLLKKEIYVTAAVAGAAVFVLMRLLGAPEAAAGGLGMVAAFVLRAGALAQGWTLLGYGRVVEEGPAPAAPPPLAQPAVVVPVVAQPTVQAPPSAETPATAVPVVKPRSPRTRAAMATPPAPPSPVDPSPDAAVLAGLSAEPATPKRTPRPRKPKVAPDAG